MRTKTNCRIALWYLACTVAPASLVGCIAATDEPSSAPADEPLGSSQEELTGVIATPSCTADEQLFAIRSVQAGRIVAASIGFFECLQTVFSSPRWLLHQMNGDMYDGPYTPVSGDPFATSSRATQVEKAFYAANSTSDVQLTCTGATPTIIGQAYIGSWSENRQAPEVMETGMYWRRDVLSRDNGLSATTADFYQLSRSIAAGTIWHEGMHQWGYRDAGSMATNGTSIGYMAGDCLSETMERSRGCTNTCGTNQRPVMRFNSTACDCVDDPQYDVGVIPAAGATCPVPQGRHVASVTQLSMDDEDSNNANAWSGWIGQTYSGPNTRFVFCAVPGSGFRRALGMSEATYAVARMGASCPSGSLPFGRVFDNEDDRNANSSSGHVPPHGSNRNTTLQMCIFGGASNGSGVPCPYFAFPYGVFAGASFRQALQTGTVFTDDEDTNNANTLVGTYYGAGTFLAANANTLLRIARVW